jgi:hypothetical protein
MSCFQRTVQFLEHKGLTPRNRRGVWALEWPSRRERCKVAHCPDAESAISSYTIAASSSSLILGGRLGPPNWAWPSVATAVANDGHSHSPATLILGEAGSFLIVRFFVHSEQSTIRHPAVLWVTFSCPFLIRLCVQSVTKISVTISLSILTISTNIQMPELNLSEQFHWFCHLVLFLVHRFLSPWWRRH